MRINVNQIPPEGLALLEEIPAAGLELEAEGLKFAGPLKVSGRINRVTNAVIAKLSVSADILMVCGRCLEEFVFKLSRDLQFEYLLDKGEQTIDLDPDIRQEVILDYPIKPLCRPDCRGLCLKCGKDLNQGKCSCENT